MFIGRQLKGNDPFNLGLTWTLRRNLVSDVIVPLPFYSFDNLTIISDELDGYIFKDFFSSTLNGFNIKKGRVIDLNYLFSVLIGVAGIQDRLCHMAKWKEGYHFKIKILNSWRTIPFLDVHSVIQRFEKNGPPMILNSTSSLPRGTDPETYISIPKYTDIDDPGDRVQHQGSFMFTAIALLFGIPPWLDKPENDPDGMDYYQELYNAAKRALDAQTKRNIRQGLLSI